MTGNGVAAFALRRAALAVVFVIVVSAASLVIVRLAPGDGAADLALSGGGMDGAAYLHARERLDRPFASQLREWAVGLAHFDLGQSSLLERPVGALVLEPAANTAVLALAALVLATVIGLPIGVLTGARPDSLLALVVAPVSIALVSCPPVVGALGLLAIAASTRWLSIAPGAIAVPALALALPLAAALERIQSQATADASRSPDLVASCARGLPPGRLLWIHAGRRSLRSVLGVYGIMVGGLFSGSLAVEIVTSWPGLARLMLKAIGARDMFLTAGCALIGAAIIAIANLAADVLRAIADPRTRA